MELHWESHPEGGGKIILNSVYPRIEVDSQRYEVSFGGFGRREWDICIRWNSSGTRLEFFIRVSDYRNAFMGTIVRGYYTYASTMLSLVAGDMPAPRKINCCIQRY